MSRKSGRRDFGSVRELRSGRFQVRWTHPGTGEQHTGPRTFTSRTDARRYLASVQTDLDRGAWSDHKLGRVLFGDWAQQRIDAVHKRQSTRATHASILKNHLTPALGSMSLAAITPSDIQALVQKWVADGASRETVRTRYGLLREVMNSAVSSGLLITSPCRGVKLPPKLPSPVQFLDVEQLKRLAAATAETYRPMVSLGGVLGLRWSEIAGLRVRRLNLLGGTLTVAETISHDGARAEVKTEMSRRTITLPPFVRDELSAHLAACQLTAADPEALLFVAPRGGPLCYSNWHDRIWAPAVEAAGLPGFHFHWLRHTAVALMVEVGTHPKVIQQRLGHSSYSTTMDVYGHLFAATEDGVSARLDEIFSDPFGTGMARARLPVIDGGL